jgi:hypothetical protein
LFRAAVAFGTKFVEPSGPDFRTTVPIRRGKLTSFTKHPPNEPPGPTSRLAIGFARPDR